MRQLNTNDKHAAALRLAERLGVTELSARELYIVRLVAWGYPAKQIAYMLDLSLHTVRQHLKNIHQVLNAHSTSDLTRYYFFREFGVADNWRKLIVTILFLLIMTASLFEMSTNVRVMRSYQVAGRMVRARNVRRNGYLKRQLS